MRRSPSGSRVGRVEDERAARLVLDRRSREVLGTLLGASRSAAEVATALGWSLDDALYRIRRLEAAGLVDVVEQRRRAGRPVKVYRSRAAAWFVPFATLPFADVEETLAALHREHAARIARASARHLARTPWAGYLVHLGDDGRVWLRGSDDPAEAPEPLGGPGWPDVPRRDDTFAPATDAVLELRLSEADARALGQELMALVARYRALDRRVEGPANHLLAVTSVPLEGD